ncbi:MAG: 50S ribosomal protein L18 [Candidatus Moraniibacteriota bacterium]|nr:MAG: 50S ribosomal protein L18 [Candidatus Moranbacteria bacterium]
MNKNTKTSKRALRVRKNLHPHGYPVARPRLSVYRSSAHIWAQLIDDLNNTTLVQANDLNSKGTKTEKAKAVGNSIAKAAIDAGIKSVVFDRGSYRYHGRIKALADSARESGLQF